MSRYFIDPWAQAWKVPEQQQQRGMKRSYNAREHSSQQSTSNNRSNNLYLNGWIPPGPGYAVKRPASQSYEYTGAHKMPRMGINQRSSSTSSIASSASSSPSMSSLRVTVPNTSRSRSMSEVEPRTSKSDAAKKSKPEVVMKETRHSKGQPTKSSPQAVKSHSTNSKAGRKSSLREEVQSEKNSSKDESRSSKLERRKSDDDSPSNSKDSSDEKSGKRKDSQSKKGPKDTDEPSSSKSASGSKALDPHISDELSRKIWSYYATNKQSKVEEAVKEELRKKLQACINQLYPYALLILGGSSLNGFGHIGCDADMCLYISDAQISQQESRNILIQLRNHLQHRCAFISHLKVIFAKVPILKFRHSRFRELECDLNINHHTGVRNTLLMQIYSRLDWRVAPLVMVIKQWAKNHGINDASQGTLSSYSYVLMVLNYLQVGCKPPVIKSVQTEEWGASIFAQCNSMVNCWNKLYDPSIHQHANQSDNSQDLFSLLKGFFTYYANFDFENTVICLRLGSCFPQSLLPANHHGWKQKYIFIEEPFDRVNTARSVFDYCRFRQIGITFNEAKHTICKSKNLDLNDFLNLQS